MQRFERRRRHDDIANAARQNQHNPGGVQRWLAFTKEQLQKVIRIHSGNLNAKLQPPQVRRSLNLGRRKSHSMSIMAKFLNYSMLILMFKSTHMGIF